MWEIKALVTAVAELRSSVCRQYGDGWSVSSTDSSSLPIADNNSVNKCKFADSSLLDIPTGNHYKKFYVDLDLAW